MSDRQSTALRSPPAKLWPPDDTEESVVGTNLHQETIANLRLGLIELTTASTEPGQPIPFHTLMQTMITALRRHDGTRYDVLPDIFVYRPWEPDVNGRWQSQQVAAAIAIEGVQVAVYLGTASVSCARAKSRLSLPVTGRSSRRRNRSLRPCAND